MATSRSLSKGPRLTAAEARILLLSRAVEEADEEGRILPLPEREVLAEEARQALGTQEVDEASPERTQAALIGRAERIMERVRERRPEVERFEATAARGTRWARPLVLLASFLLGLSLNALGDGRRINVLSFPLLGLLLWNLGLYLFLLWEVIRGRDRKLSSSPLAGVLAWVSSPRRSWTRFRGEGEGKILTEAATRFGERWLGAAATLYRARAETTFHLGAMLVGIGLLVGMYLRGIAFEYNAYWESTSLEADGASALLSLVLGPAAALLGRADLLSPEHLTQIQDPAAAENAAPWIHLIAVTVGLVVLVPRALLAFLCTRRAQAIESDFPLALDTDGYFVRLSAKERGGGSGAVILSYSYTPSARARDGLRALLLDVLGNRARVEWAPDLEYGAEWDEAEIEDGVDCIVVLFNSAQSPEAEV
ncbi:MAG: hypothetical protein AAF368_02710, partial [Planctomycetota bacterium]